MEVNEKPGREYTALVVLAPGFEEIEALTPVDLLRRAGFKVVMAGLGSGHITGSHGITVLADFELEPGQALADVLVLPGGPGTRVLAASSLVTDLVLEHWKQKRLLAAICAAPAVVLHPLGLLRDRTWTCFTDMEKGLGDGEFLAAPCVQDGNLITARGVGAAADFALAIVHSLMGSAKARAIHRQTVQAGDAPVCERRN